MERTVRISNGKIEADVCLPDAEEGFYRGTRFDWSGVISSLKYAGHEYFGPWFDESDAGVHDFEYRQNRIVAGTCSAITGPAEEFSDTLGYDDAEAGGIFVKIGVGVLRKPQEAHYDHCRLYDIVDGGRWTARSDPSSVAFRHVLQAPSGYAYEYQKVVRLDPAESVMRLEHRLNNTGNRVIETSVYNHNFLALDRSPPGPEFRITLPFAPRAAEQLTLEPMVLSGREILCSRRLDDQDCVEALLEGFGSDPADYDIRIDNRRVGAGLRITGTRPLARLNLWAIRSVLALEPFVAIRIDPGCDFSWDLSYTFFG